MQRANDVQSDRKRLVSRRETAPSEAAIHQVGRDGQAERFEQLCRIEVMAGDGEQFDGFLLTVLGTLPFK